MKSNGLFQIDELIILFWSKIAMKNMNPRHQAIIWGEIKDFPKTQEV